MTDVGVGAAVRASRERLGWNREALAYHSGVSMSAIAQIESGRRKDVRLSSLSGLARALGVTVDYLVGGDSTATPPLLGHRVLTYGSDDEFIRAAVPFLAEGMQRSECVFAVTTLANTQLLQDALGSDAARVEFADMSEWYRTPQGALGSYRQLLQERREARASWVRIIGEPVWVGRSPKEIKAWTRYESLINLAFAAAPATFVCAYDARSAPAGVLADAQRTHPELQLADGVAASPSYRHPEDSLLEIG
jgi:transcriptional regulator with XRE-family HTH domain